MKNKHAQALGSLGGEARKASLSTEQMKAIARKGASTLWQDHNPNPPCTCKGCKTRARKETR